MARTLASLTVVLLLSSCTSPPRPTIEPARVADRAADLVLARLQEAALAPAPDAPQVQEDSINSGRPWRGAEAPLVTMVEVTDFQCPFCSRVVPTVERILETYGDEVRVVFRSNPLPFHQDAPLAHQAALSVFHQAGSEAFWSFHDRVFANQRGLTRANLERWATEAGVADLDALRRDLDRSTYQDLVAEDQEWARSLGLRGTPSFVINGQTLAGAQPYERFREVLEEELATARTLLEEGVPQSRLFATRLQEARAQAETAPPPRPPSRPQPDPAAVYHVPLGSAPLRGSARALVTIVEVSDFECPFCARVQPTLEQIEQHYGPDVRIAFKHNPLPFHQNAMLAAIAAAEAQRQMGNRGFWAMHDLLFANQRALTRNDLEGYAQQMGLNMNRFRRALDQRAHEQLVRDDQQLVTSLGATGTPSFFINGRNLRGAQPFPAFQAVIDEELTRARSLLRAGTARDRIYEAAIAGGATTPQTVGGAAAAGTPPTVYQVPLPSSAPTLGPANARVTVQIFTDFECPFCGRVQPTLDQLTRQNPSDVRLVFRNYPLPFHRNAMLTHEAAWEVFEQLGDRAFWDYHDVLFQNRSALSRSDLEGYARQLGRVDMARFRRALDQHTHQQRIQDDIDAIRAAGARIGTPSFFFNGRLLQGAQPFPSFDAAVQRELSPP